LESDYKDYLDKMIDLIWELKRVLKPTGTMWVNLGDTYSSKTKGTGGMNSEKLKIKNNENYQAFRSATKTNIEIMEKSLMLIPHRFAIRCIDELGLILRNDIIWAKPNGMPESTTDRFSKKHEFIFFFVKNQKYYFDLDSVRENIKEASRIRLSQNIESQNGSYRAVLGGYKNNGTMKAVAHSLGKNPGDVSDFWEITTKPNPKNHYATYNSELIRKPLIAGSPVGGVILDPFGGTGTTCFLATQFERRFIYIDANKEYFNNFVKEMSYRESQYKLNFEDVI